MPWINGFDFGVRSVLGAGYRNAAALAVGLSAIRFILAAAGAGPVSSRFPARRTMLHYELAFLLMMKNMRIQ